MPRIIGLTGGIASGKSTVAATWSAAGAYVIDADAVAREVVQPGQPALYLIRKRFGAEVICSDGTLDRGALGRLIFSDSHARAALNRRIHPFIILSMLSRLLKAVFWRMNSVIVLNTPLLYESKTLLPFCSKVVVVDCSVEQQVERMVKRDGESKGITVEEARKRLDAQIPLKEKAKMADVVIDNSASEERLAEKADKVLNELQPAPAGEIAFRALTCAVVGKTFMVLFGALAQKIKS